MSTENQKEEVVRAKVDAIKKRLDGEREALMSLLPDSAALTDDMRKEIIARYTAVLEGNFIPWMTSAHLGAKSDEAKAITKDNLVEELRDNHPGMLRRFATMANSIPTNEHYIAVGEPVEEIRQFAARLNGVELLVMMGFFESFIAGFMPYLNALAKESGSSESEYTDVHAAVDIVHTEGLFKALEYELAITDSSEKHDEELLAGVEKIKKAVLAIIA